MAFFMTSPRWTQLRQRLGRVWASGMIVVNIAQAPQPPKPGPPASQVDRQARQLADHTKSRVWPEQRRRAAEHGYRHPSSAQQTGPPLPAPSERNHRATGRGRGRT